MVAKSSGTNAIRVPEELPSTIRTAAEYHHRQKNQARSNRKRENTEADDRDDPALHIGDLAHGNKAPKGKHHGEVRHPGNGSNANQAQAGNGTHGLMRI